MFFLYVKNVYLWHFSRFKNFLHTFFVEFLGYIDNFVYLHILLNNLVLCHLPLALVLGFHHHTTVSIHCHCYNFLVSLQLGQQIYQGWQPFTVAKRGTAGNSNNNHHNHFNFCWIKACFKWLGFIFLYINQVNRSSTVEVGWNYCDQKSNITSFQTKGLPLK